MGAPRWGWDSHMWPGDAVEFRFQTTTTETAAKLAWLESQERATIGRTGLKRGW